MISAKQQDLYTKFEALMIDHALFQSMYSLVKNSLEFNSQGRMIAIVGAGGCGKSSLVRALARHFSASKANDDTQAPSPYADTVIFICPPPTTRSDYWITFVEDLLELLCATTSGEYAPRRQLSRRNELFSDFFPRDSDKYSSLKRKLRLALEYRRVKKLFLDESAHILRASSPKKFVNQLDVLKVYCDQLGIDLTLAGPPELLAIQAINGQLSWRVTMQPFPTYDLSVTAHVAELSSIVSRFQHELSKFGISGVEKYEEELIYGSSGDIGVAKKCFLRLAEILIPAGRYVVTDKDIKMALKTDSQRQSILAEIDLMRTEFGNNPLEKINSEILGQPARKYKRRVGARKPTRDPLGPRT